MENTLCLVIHCVSALLHHRSLYINFTNLDKIYVHISNHWQIMMSDNANDLMIYQLSKMTVDKKQQQMIGQIIQKNYQK